MADSAHPGKTAGKKRAKLNQRENRTNQYEKQLSGLLSKAKPKAPVDGDSSEYKGRRCRRGATLTLYQSGKVTEAIKEPDPPKYAWQSRLLAKRFPKCTAEQIAEALRCFDGDTDKASIICERQSRNAEGPVLGAGDQPLSMEELDVLGSKQLAQLAKKLRFKLVGNENQMRQRLAALVGLSPDVMVRLEWILDAAMAAKLPSIDREGAATIRAHIAEGRFTAAHYIQMFTERLRISEADAIDEPESDPEEENPADADQDAVQPLADSHAAPAVVNEGALRHDVYKRLRKVRCGKHLRIRVRLSHADKLRNAGTLAGSSPGSADFRVLMDMDRQEVALGSTWKRASQLLDFEVHSDDGSDNNDEEVVGLAARRRREWRASEHDVDSWFTGSNRSTANVVALATEGAQVGQQFSVAGKLGALVIPRGMSPPVDSPSSPVKGHRRRQPLPENRVMMERRLANIGQPIGGLSTVDPDLEAWREDLQRRRVDAAKIGLQLTRRLPDLDLKPVWLDDVEGNQLAMYDQLATAGRARS